MRFAEQLRHNGYALFRGAVDARVYAFFSCGAPRKAVWYHKRGSYQCAGCKRRCETASALGFQIFLDV